VKNANFLVEHQCPQCGAPVVLEETERFFTCSYCRVKSYLMHHGYLRYYLPAKTPQRPDLFYIPYWRFKGMGFSLQASQTTHRFIDTSQQAVNLSGMPPSLGLRPQAINMRFVLPDTPGQFIKPQVPKIEAMQTVERRMQQALKRCTMRQFFIGESISIIYAPFYGTNRLFDGILEQPLGAEFDLTERLIKAPASKPARQFSFVPSLCPACGWDMQGRPDTRVLHCTNCTTAWMASRSGFKQVPFSHWKAKHPAETDRYLPFWRIQADASGIQLDSYADLVRIANLPKAVQESWGNRPFRFWVPAIKIKPKRFLRLSTSLTLSQPRWKPLDKMPAPFSYPVTLPLKEAIECLMITLGEIVKPRKSFAANFPQIQLKPASALLVYLPFAEGHHEYICRELQVAINKNVLSHADNL
jgi:ribosomal protein L37AE/L43A